jgi:hypothetical protein
VIESQSHHELTDRRDSTLLTSIALQIEWMRDRNLKKRGAAVDDVATEHPDFAIKTAPNSTSIETIQGSQHTSPSLVRATHQHQAIFDLPFKLFAATDSKAVSVTGLPSQPSRSSFRCRLRIINIRPSSTSAEFLIHTFSDCSFCAHSPQVVASHKTQAQRSAHTLFTERKLPVCNPSHL